MIHTIFKNQKGGGEGALIPTKKGDGYPIVIIKPRHF